MIDWDVAISDRRQVGGGPGRSQPWRRGGRVVAELRELAVAVAEPVHEVTE